MTMQANGKAVVTGASTGIGAVYADRLAHRGFDLILVARNAERMEMLAARLRRETGGVVTVMPADLTKRSDLERVERLFAEDGAITMLVNNAGMSLKGGLLDAESADLDSIMALNIVAPTRLARAAAKAFAARNAGTIVNLASVLALAPEISDAVYSGSKAYILNLSLALQEKLKGTGVHVQAVLPGATRTEIWERGGRSIDSLAPEILMEVDDLVDAALVGLDRGERITIPPLAEEGQWIAFNAARLAMAPNLSRREVAPRYRRAAAAAAA